MELQATLQGRPKNGAAHPVPARPIRILLVESDPEEAARTRQVLRESKIWNDLRLAEDGDQALEILLRQGRFADAPRPDLVLLDLQLSQGDGRDVLRTIRHDPEFSDLPVVVLLRQGVRRDVLDAFALKVTAVLAKPIDLGKLYRVVLSVGHFGLTLSTAKD